MSQIVLDTNVFVAAGFNRGSASARLVEAVKNGQLRLVWDDATRRETEKVIASIPPLRADRLEGVFIEENRFEGEISLRGFEQVPDPTDRKFAALADAAGAILVSKDDHLLGQRETLDIEVLRPSEAAERLLEQ